MYRGGKSFNMFIYNRFTQTHCKLCFLAMCSSSLSEITSLFSSVWLSRTSCFLFAVAISAACFFLHLVRLFWNQTWKWTNKFFFFRFVLALASQNKISFIYDIDQGEFVHLFKLLSKWTKGSFDWWPNPSITPPPSYCIKFAVLRTPFRPDL